MRAWLITTAIMVVLLYVAVSTHWPGAQGYYPGAAYWYLWLALADGIFLLMLYLVERHRFFSVLQRFLEIGRDGLPMVLFVLTLIAGIVGISSYGAAALLVWFAVGSVA